MSEQRGLRVVVAVPTHDAVPALFSYDLAQMMAYTCVNFVGPGQPIEAINLTYVVGTYVHSARQQLAESALAGEADYILWLDSDMRFPKDTLTRLLLHRTDIVGINYAQRGVPTDFVAIKSVDQGVKCVTGPDTEGLEEVEAIGFGAALMRTQVFKSLPDPTGDAGPWFAFRWRPDLQQMVGEDVLFCQAVRAAGHRVFVDHDLSKQCAHIGQLEYRVEHAQDTQE